MNSRLGQASRAGVGGCLPHTGLTPGSRCHCSLQDSGICPTGSSSRLESDSGRQENWNESGRQVPSAGPPPRGSGLSQQEAQELVLRAHWVRGNPAEMRPWPANGANNNHHRTHSHIPDLLGRFHECYLVTHRSLNPVSGRPGVRLRHLPSPAQASYVGLGALLCHRAWWAQPATNLS